MRAILVGCGPIGCRVAAMAAGRPDIELVGAVDVDPGKLGRDVGELGNSESLGVSVSDDAADLVSKTKPDVAFHATGSSFRAVYPQIAGLLEAGVNVVSTCEELSYPYRREPGLAGELDRLAKKNGVTVLATGINPGFLMDTWPLFMTAVCQEVKSIKAVRVQDASSRRLPFQQKIGAGCTPEEFRQRVAAGTLRHVGLEESIAMIAAGLGFELDDISETIEPVMADGQVAGVRQVGRGMRGGREVITLEFVASLGAPESYDAVKIEGTPDLEVRIPGGVHGDLGTAAVVVNAARRVVEAPPGLLCMKDMPVITPGSTFTRTKK